MKNRRKEIAKVVQSLRDKKMEKNKRYSLKFKPEMTPEYTLKGSYAQEEDCEKPVDETPEDGYNFLEFETTNGGGGTYWVMKTKRWAFDDPHELIEIIKDFIRKSKFIKDDDNNKS